MVEEALEEIEEDDLFEAFADDPDGVNTLYDAVKVLTDLLKNSLASTLEVSLPGSISGDND